MNKDEFFGTTSAKVYVYARLLMPSRYSAETLLIDTYRRIYEEDYTQYDENEAVKYCLRKLFETSEMIPYRLLISLKNKEEKNGRENDF